MPLAALDPLGGVIANATPMAIGFHALAIQNRRRGLGSFVVGFADENARRGCPDQKVVVIPTAAARGDFDHNPNAGDQAGQIGRRSRAQVNSDN